MFTPQPFSFREFGRQLPWMLAYSVLMAAITLRFSTTFTSVMAVVLALYAFDMGATVIGLTPRPKDLRWQPAVYAVLSAFVIFYSLAVEETQHWPVGTMLHFATIKPSGRPVTDHVVVAFQWFLPIMPFCLLWLRRIGEYLERYAPTA